MTVRPFRRLLVVTGDHRKRDATKWSGGYTEDDLDLHREMQRTFESLGEYEVEVLSDHDRLLSRLLEDPPDFVVNFCDTGLHNVATQELHVPALLESLGIPYSGAPPAGMVLCYDKSIVRLIAEAHGIATPIETYVSPDTEPEEIDCPFPALVKPARGDGSVGITRDAVVHDRTELESYLEWFRKQLGKVPALVQEYLPGTEYGLALVGNPAQGFTAFPPLEVDYSRLPAELPPILAFESKTGPDAAYSVVEVRRARLGANQLERMRQAAELLFARLECRDYARFDFRTAADGEIKLMEVNPNPAWSSAAKLALMASFAGLGYRDLLSLILETARARLEAGS